MCCACVAGFFAASLNAVNLTMCSHKASNLARSFDWFCSSWFLQFLVTIVAPYILLIVWQNAVIPAQMYRCGGRSATLQPRYLGSSTGSPL